MTKQKLLYASPFAPLESGISDYSEVLVYGLREYFDITLVITDYKLSNKQMYNDFTVLKIFKDSINFEQYPYRIYNIGNQPYFHSYIYYLALEYPGMIILHDFILYFLMVGFYRDKNTLYSKIYELAGAEGIQLIKEYTKRKVDLLECKHLAPLLPLNRELLNSKNKIMVHSWYTYANVEKVTGEKKRIAKINMLEQIPENMHFREKNSLFRQYGIPEDATLICSFGFIAPTKLNREVCEVIRRIAARVKKKIVYLMVGEGTYVDNYLSDVIKKTGYINLQDFNAFVRYADIVVNLRHPSMGETSAALIRCLGLGKPCIVSDEAWFSELPDSVVLKVKNEKVEEEIYKALYSLLEDEAKSRQLGTDAKKFIKEQHSRQKISREIFQFLTNSHTSA